MAYCSFIYSQILPTYLPTYGSTAFCYTLATFSVYYYFSTVGRTPWTGYQHVARQLTAHRTAQTE
jgi:hypothetical protein